MKEIKQIIILALLVTFSSCASTQKIELGANVSQKGIEVSQKALNVLNTLEEQSYIGKKLEDISRILVSPNLSDLKLPDTEQIEILKQLQPRIDAYKSLLSIYQTFNKLADSNHGERTFNATSALQSSYNTVQSLPGLPDSIRNNNSEFTRLVTQSMQAKKIMEYNQEMYILTKIYVDIWERDHKTWSNVIDGFYDSYINRLNSLPISKFDLTKIAKDENFPFKDDEVAISIYRLKEREKFESQKNAVKQELTNLTKALNELNKLHAELMKPETDLSSIIYLINSIDNLLKK